MVKETYIHIQIYIHTYIHTYIRTHTHTRGGLVHVMIYDILYMSVSLNTYTYIHTHTHTYIHTHTYLTGQELSKWIPRYSFDPSCMTLYDSYKL